MAELEIDLGSDLFQGVMRLAEGHYGDHGPASMSSVIEDALEVRLLCSERLQRAGQEVDEPVTNWEFGGGPVFEETRADITDWLFDRKEAE